MRLSDRQERHILHHGSVAQVFRGKAAAHWLRRYVLGDGAGDENATPDCCQAQAEIEVLAPYPEVIPVETCFLHGSSLDEEANTLGPIKVRDLITELAPILLR